MYISQYRNLIIIYFIHKSQQLSFQFIPFNRQQIFVRIQKMNYQIYLYFPHLPNSTSLLHPISFAFKIKNSSDDQQISHKIQFIIYLQLIFYNLSQIYHFEMSIKTLLFGRSSFLSQLLQTINPNLHFENEETVHVENMTINQKNFMNFIIHDRSLISQQSVGTNALVFFIDHSKPLYEEKQFLVDILNSRRQFESIPLVVLFEKQQGFNIKDVINYFELFKMKQRTSMIKEVNFTEKQSVIDVFQWIESQSQMRKSMTSFDAMPKVVKLKPKYRQSQQDQSVKKYQGLLKDKQFRVKNVKDQQQQYIEEEKQRIKNQNMEKQLANFNKNKKKMTPYDIKASPNPKIEANLHFFLKDPKSQKQPEVNIKIQTDEFKPRPQQKSYVPKKTGINISTQIQQNELFSFDKEVKPILNILVIKALETAALQIEQEQEFARIQKYKSAYNERVRKQIEHEKQMIEEELALIKRKEKLLEESRKKHEVKKAIKKRLICYDVGNRFLTNIYKRANLNLFNKNQYVDQYENDIHTAYVEKLIDKTAAEVKKLTDKQVIIQGVFEKDCITPILQMAQGPKKERQILKSVSGKRKINQSQNERVFHILYKHEHQNFSTFSMHLPKYFDNTLDDFIKSKEEEHQQVTDKMANGDLPEDESTKRKIAQNIEFGKNHQAFLIDNEKQLCFVGTANRYEKPSQGLMSLGFLLVDREGDIIETDFADKNFDKVYSFARHVKGLRMARNVVNMDEGIQINLKCIPDNVKSVVLLTKFNNVNKYNDEGENKKVKHASYGLEFYEYNIAIHKENIAEKINWGEIVKGPEGDEAPQQNDMAVLCVSYILHRKSDGLWTLEHARYVSKPTQNFNHLVEDIAKFYAKSLEIFKQEDQQQANQAMKKQQSKKERKSRSKKTVQGPVQIPVKVKTVIKVQTRVFPQIRVSLRQSLEQVQSILEGSIKQWTQFIDSCEAGYKILIKGKSFESVQQLKQVKRVGDIQVMKLKPVVEEKKENQHQQGDQNGDAAQDD